MNEKQFRGLVSIVLVAILIVLILVLAKSKSAGRVTTQSWPSQSVQTDQAAGKQVYPVMDESTGINFPNNVRLEYTKNGNVVMAVRVILGPEALLTLSQPLQTSCESVVTADEFCFKGYVVASNGSAAAADLIAFLKANN
jgi:hypothetical protein